MKTRKKLLIAGIVVAAVVVGNIAWHFLSIAEWNHYLQYGFPTCREYIYAKANCTFFDCALESSDASKTYVNAFTYDPADPPPDKIKVPNQWTLVPGDDTQDDIDKINDAIAVSHYQVKMGEWFAVLAYGEANERDVNLHEYNVAYFRQTSTIETLRARLNALDGVTNKLTLDEVLRDPDFSTAVYLLYQDWAKSADETS